MFLRKTMAVAIVLTAVLNTGCASIVGDSKYAVNVTSSPSDASFQIINKAGQIIQSGKTPHTVTLKSGRGYFKGQTYTLVFKKEGYSDQTVILDSSLSGWYWGNLLVGGVIGMLIVDPLTGAMYKLPENVAAVFGEPRASSPENDNMTVVMMDSLTPETREKLIRIN